MDWIGKYGPLPADNMIQANARALASLIPPKGMWVGTATEKDAASSGSDAPAPAPALAPL